MARKSTECVVLVLSLAYLLAFSISETGAEDSTIFSDMEEPFVSEEYSDVDSELPNNGLLLPSESETLRGKFHPLDFYKLSLQWPSSYCNVDKKNCKSPIITHFTIRGLWPIYNPDKTVPPYNESGCSLIVPTKPNDITPITLGFLLPDLKKYWPNLNNYTSDEKNLELWRTEWKQHGMCSAFPQQPQIFYAIAVDFIKTNNILEILKNAAILPDNRSYNKDAITAAITKRLGVVPQIACNRDVKGAEQLLEIRICLNNNISPKQGCHPNLPIAKGKTLFFLLPQPNKLIKTRQSHNTISLCKGNM